jgi:two-component system chemotaxis response regulator CheY
MKTLIVEDDETSAKLMSYILAPYSLCDFAANGLEAIKLFSLSLNKNEPYNLICLDIMMPEMDGHDVLKKIREIEYEKNIYGQAGVKIIMTSALSDSDNILSAFREQCEGYIIKPVEKSEFLATLKKIGIIKE